MRISTLLVGLGKIGMGYDHGSDPAEQVYTHARAFSLHPAFRLVGGVDAAARQRETFEREFQCPAFGTIGDALASLQPELLVIAAPTACHAEILFTALDRSHPLAVLCEKPLSYALDEAQAMLQACADQGVQLYVNYMRRSDPGVAEIKRRLQTGEIAMPLKGVAWYSKGFLHNGSHFFNLLRYWLGSVLETQIIANGRLWDTNDPEPDVRVFFEAGEVMFLAAKEEYFSHYTVELLAANGRLRYEQGGHWIGWQPAKKHPQLDGYTVLASDAERIGSGLQRYQWHVAEQLALALQGKAAQLCDGAEALYTLENMRRILDKRHHGQ